MRAWRPAILAKSGMPIWIAGAAACLLGTVFGSLNGALVAYVGIPSIVVTLATMTALRDGLRWATEGAWVQDLPPVVSMARADPGSVSRSSRPSPPA